MYMYICTYVHADIYCVYMKLGNKKKNKIQVKLKLKYDICDTKKFPQKVLGPLNFGSYQNCMIYENLVTELQLKLSNGRAFSTAEPCSCEYITLLQSFRRGALSKHWRITQKNLVFSWRKISCFSFMYTVPPVLVFISSFHIYNLKLGR